MSKEQEEFVEMLNVYLPPCAMALMIEEAQKLTEVFKPLAEDLTKARDAIGGPLDDC